MTPRDPKRKRLSPSRTRDGSDSSSLGLDFDGVLPSLPPCLNYFNHLPSRRRRDPPAAIHEYDIHARPRRPAIVERDYYSARYTHYVMPTDLIIEHISAAAIGFSNLPLTRIVVEHTERRDNVYVLEIVISDSR